MKMKIESIRDFKIIDKIKMIKELITKPKTKIEAIFSKKENFWCLSKKFKRKIPEKIWEKSKSSAIFYFNKFYIFFFFVKIKIICRQLISW